MNRAFAYDPLTQLIPKGIQWQGLPRPERDDVEYWNGRLLIWAFPDSRRRYVIGVDPAKGMKADRGVIQVLKVGTVSEPDEQVAEFASDTHDPVQLAEIASAVGRMYGGCEDEALAIVELNSAGGGDTTQSDMRFKWGYSSLYLRKQEQAVEAGYIPSFGWMSGPGNRAKAVSRGRNALQSGDLVVHSPLLLEELADFQPETFASKAQAASGKHDDRVMALFIAYLGAHEDEWLSGENMSRQRRILTAAGGARDTEAVVGVRRDWQNTVVSAEDMWASWDHLLDADG